jgi:alpha-glucosidase
MSSEWNPEADESAVVRSTDGRARFTVLTDRLIRMEWSRRGAFEDRASRAFVNRRLPVPAFRVERVRGVTRIITDRLWAEHREDGQPFHSGNLVVRGGVGDRPFEWRPGDDASGNLGGTARTLDGVNGRCAVEPGILSRGGWAVVDDSAGLVFEPGARVKGVQGWEWLTPRTPEPDALDWYVFGHGRDYAAGLRDFTGIGGRIPLPPRYVFGVWWSRYWAYTADGLKTLVEEFRAHDVPLDVLVIDMDWHLDGWTGYTWNPKYFPDPRGFLAWTDTHGLQITLNLHPADGVGRHEIAFESLCRWMQFDPETARVVPFDCTDRRFVEGYFRFLHWPLEKQGVDFWWMDWQQGTKTKTPGLDPLWWLNHLHWKDLEERSEPSRDESGARRGRRPLIFSRWGGLGNHRYPIGFSGDTFSTWECLAWQPEFTATAGNVGYAYWSHDIGGHQPGPVEPELYLRWIQFGALSPVLRTHTSKNPRGERRIWASPEREFKAMREAFRLRYRLLPYIYSAARRCFDEALPLCRPLYHGWPEAPEAYDERFRPEYLFGDDLLAAPIVSPGDRLSRCAAARVWVPPGTWTNWFTGESIEGPREVEWCVPLEEVPLLARGGAIVPAAPSMRWSGETPVDPLTLIIWPGGSSAEGWRHESGSTRLYEDDGEGAGYARGECAWTPIAMRRAEGLLRLQIGPAEGAFRAMLERRGYEVRIVDRWPARGVRINGVEHAFEYDEAKLTIVVRIEAAARERIDVEVTLDPADESPLRAGVHGRLKVLESIGAMLGEEAPRRLREAAAGGLRRAVIAGRGATCGKWFAPETMWGLAREVQASAAPIDRRQEAIARLLGFVGRIELRPGGRAGTIRTSARARFIGPMAESAHGIEVRVAPSRGWQAVERSAAAGVEECEWNIGSTARSAALRTSALLHHGGESIELVSEARVLPSIDAWWVVGPFECPFGRAMATAFGPERSEGKNPSPSETYSDGAGGLVHWRRVERSLRAGEDPATEFVVDLHEVFGRHHDDAVAYGMTYVDAAEDRDLILSIGSDDGVSVWVNGELVHTNDVQRGYGSMQDSVPIRLRAGRNVMVLKITQAKGAWAFGAHLLDASGGEAGGVESTLDEPKD